MDDTAGRDYVVHGRTSTKLGQNPDLLLNLNLPLLIQPLYFEPTFGSFARFSHHSRSCYRSLSAAGKFVICETVHGQTAASSRRYTFPRRCSTRFVLILTCFFKEMESWSRVATNLNKLNENYYQNPPSVDLVGRVNRLISAWPQDDTLPAEGYEGLRPVFKKLTPGLQEIKRHADQETSLGVCYPFELYWY